MPQTIAHARHFAIIARDDPPAFVLERIVPLIVKHQALVPRWCRTLTLRWADGGEDFTLQTETSTEYRWASLTVHASWLNDRPEAMEECVVHELLHIPIQRTLDFVHQLLKQYVKDETTHEMLSALFEKTYEASVEDLAQGVWESLNPSS